MSLVNETSTPQYSAPLNYTQLTSIPLFTGISGEDLAIIMDRVELLDVELQPGETFVREGDICHCMAIVKDGKIARTQTRHAGVFVNSRKQECPISYQVTETLMPPVILEPEVLFGLDLRHKNTWTASTTCHLTLISKEDIRQTLMYVPIWRINFINLLCTDLQRSISERQSRVTPDHKRLVTEFLLKHCSHRGDTLSLDITIEQLGYCLGVNRRTLAGLLDDLQEQGLIEKHKQKFLVPSIEALRAIS